MASFTTQETKGSLQFYIGRFGRFALMASCFLCVLEKTSVGTVSFTFGFALGACAMAINVWILGVGFGSLLFFHRLSNAFWMFFVSFFGLGTLCWWVVRAFPDSLLGFATGLSGLAFFALYAALLDKAK